MIKCNKVKVMQLGMIHGVTIKVQCHLINWVNDIYLLLVKLSTAHIPVFQLTRLYS